MVINSNPQMTREQVGPMRNRLMRLGIHSHLAGVDTEPNFYFRPAINW